MGKPVKVEVKSFEQRLQERVEEAAEQARRDFILENSEEVLERAFNGSPVKAEVELAPTKNTEYSKFPLPRYHDPKKAKAVKRPYSYSERSLVRGTLWSAFVAVINLLAVLSFFYGDQTGGAIALLCFNTFAAAIFIAVFIVNVGDLYDSRKS